MSGAIKIMQKRASGISRKTTLTEKVD